MDKSQIHGESNLPLYIAIAAIFVIMSAFIFIIPKVPAIVDVFKGWLL